MVRHKVHLHRLPLVLAQVLVQVVLAKVVAETKGKAKDVVAENHLELAQVAQAHEEGKAAKDQRKVKSKDKDSVGKLARIVVRDLVAGILQREQVQRADLAINQVGVPLRVMDKLVEEVKEEVTINVPLGNLGKDKAADVVEAEALIKVDVVAAEAVEDNYIVDLMVNFSG